MEHSGEHLLDHLLATRALVESWGARPALCDAVLFHSVYGTEFLGEGIVGTERRAEVRTLIGDESEALAWLWHAVRRESLADNLGRSENLRVDCRDGTVASLSRQQFEDLVNLMIADAVEQLPRRGAESAERQQKWLSPFLRVAMPQAALAARECFRRQGAGAGQAMHAP